MGEFIEKLLNVSTELVYTLGPLFGMFLIILESIIPILPLAVFIALNTYTFGSVVGFVLSWIATIIGCILSFLIFRRYIRDFIYNRYANNKKVIKLIDFIGNVSFTKLVLVIALPFTPAFLVNIAAGLSNISIRKFIVAIIFGKLSIIYFWGYIGTSFIESITDPFIILKTIILLLAAYVVSKLIDKKFNIE
ncbi:MAG: VTT domain-containing protein [Bacilli bacterium]|nr:VTT domain-containing protein [Bacilli bacterium]